MTSQRPLDRTDHHIIRLLQQKARLSNKEVAAAAGVSASTCSDRTRRMEREGVLRGFHADVSPEALGIGVQAIVSVRLRRQNADEVDAFLGHVRPMLEVANVFHVSGANDFLVHICVRDTHHLRKVVVETFSSFPEIGHLESSLVFDHLGNGILPDFN